MDEQSNSVLDSGMLPESRSEQFLMPTPFAAAGIGLLIAFALPGGMTGGQGFLLGLFIGMVLSVLMPIIAARDRPATVRCPECGAMVDCTRDSVHSRQSSDMGDGKGTSNG
jgi:hypothetical protein